MIKLDISSKHEAADVQHPNAEYSVGDINAFITAKNFADNLFSRTSDEIQHDMLAEVFDYDESNCAFDSFEIGKPISEILNEIREHWDGIDDNGKIELCTQFSKLLSDRLEISNPPKCKFYTAEEGNYGFYSKADNTININKRYFSYANEIVNTIAHETRHAYQARRADICQTYTDELYKCNFDNYVGLEYVDGNCVNFFDYYNQFVEVEARAFADMFKI